MDVPGAAADVLLGASLQQIAAAFRDDLIRHFGFRADEVTPDTFRNEVVVFMRKLARHLGDRHRGDVRAGQALREWIRQSDDYDAWDALLSGFAVDGREALVRAGRMRFPGPLTAHWEDA